MLRSTNGFSQARPYKSLSVYSRCLYIEIKRRYNGHNNGEISLSHREAEVAVGCSNKPIAAAFLELQEKGFIQPQQKGSFDWKTRLGPYGTMRATTWVLTEQPQDFPVRSLSATKNFMKWKPPEKKSRYAEGIPMVGREHTIESETVRPEHTNGVPRAYHNGQNHPGDGTPRAYTYNLPDTYADPDGLQPIGPFATTALKTARERPAKSKGTGAQRAATGVR